MRKQNLNRQRRVSKQKRLNSRRRMLNDQFSKISTTSAPVALSSTVRYMDPYISSTRRSRNNGQVECRVRHRELVAVIDGSVAFNVSTYPVQPGLQTTFPWLSNMATNWENYKFNRIGFRYVSRSSTAFTGSVSIAPDYDASDTPPTSYQELSSYQNVVSDAPWKDFVCQLSPRSTTLVGNSRYIRLGALSNNEDIKLYDVANLQVATVGQANTAVVGELWVEYDITLQIPQIQTPEVVSNVSAGQYFSQTGVDVTHLLGTQDDGRNGQIVISPVNNTVTITNMDPGQWYAFVYDIEATTTLTTIPTMTIVSGLDAGLSQVNLSVTNTTTKAMMSYWMLCTNATAVITLGGLAVVTGGTRAYLWIATFLAPVP